MTDVRDTASMNEEMNEGCLCQGIDPLRAKFAAAALQSVLYEWWAAGESTRGITGFCVGMADALVARLKETNGTDS